MCFFPHEKSPPPRCEIYASNSSVLAASMKMTNLLMLG